MKAVALVIIPAIGILVAPIAAVAQPASKVARVGYLSGNEPSAIVMRRIDGFRQGLRERGWEEGRNVVIEWRFAHGRYDRLDDLAAELVRLNVDVIVTEATPAALAAKHATRTIPIVLGLAGDPVRTGLVASLARPGGNVTGMSLMLPELSGKQLELLKEVVPTATRVAVLLNPGNPYHAALWSEAQRAARVLGVQLRSFEVRAAPDLDRALSMVTSWRAHAVWIFGDPAILSLRRRIADFAVGRWLPTIATEGEFSEAGVLMTYWPSFSGVLRRAAVFVDKILKGAKPADLPVEQPTNFELVVNLKTAKALGLTIPQSVLVRADEVIR